MPFQALPGMSRQGSYVPTTEADWNGAGQCFRFVQHRHRPFKFPHGRTDACGRPFCRPLGQ